MSSHNKKTQNKKYPCENAFLTNPVASANDVTGYVQRLPKSADVAENYAELCDVPVSSRDGNSRAPDAK